VVSIILISAGIKKSQKEKSFNIENYQWLNLIICKIYV
jgi:hypothetical protein